MKIHFYRSRIVLIVLLILSQASASLAAVPEIFISAPQAPCHMNMEMSSDGTSSLMKPTDMVQLKLGTFQGMDCCDVDHNGDESCLSDCQCTVVTSFVPALSMFERANALVNQSNAFSDESQFVPDPFLSLLKRPPIHQLS